MKHFEKPEIEIIEFLRDDSIMTSDGCPGYKCPGLYGDTCTGHTNCPAKEYDPCSDF